MRRLLIACLLGSAAAPALAQHQGHGGHDTGQHAGHGAPETQPAQPDPQAGHEGHDPAEGQPARPDPHAGHAMPEGAEPHAAHGGAEAQPAQPDPHAGHAVPQSGDPHAGHGAATAAEPDPHAGHAMPATGESQGGHATGGAAPAAPPVAPPPPEAFAGPEHAADTVFGADEMAEAREGLRREHGDIRAYRFTVDQLELSLRDGREGYAWEDAQFWYGDDIDRLWIKSEGEGEFGGDLEAAEVQALWSHALDPWFNLQAGLRYDFAPDPERAYLVLGVQGLAPYWFEVDAAAFLSDEGDLSARLEVEYDQRITQRLILQPRLEADFQLQDVPELGLGAGLSSAELGLRLRYEIVPEFAPYVGVQYERAFGDTADFARAAGEDVGGWSFLAGVRLWF